jgi:hypothetical protein
MILSRSPLITSSSRSHWRRLRLDSGRTVSGTSCLCIIGVDCRSAKGERASH